MWRVQEFRSSRSQTLHTLTTTRPTTLPTILSWPKLIRRTAQTITRNSVSLSLLDPKWPANFFHTLHLPAWLLRVLGYIYLTCFVCVCVWHITIHTHKAFGSHTPPRKKKPCWEVLPFLDRRFQTKKRWYCSHKKKREYVNNFSY